MSLYLSPKAKGLFRGAIAQSGVVNMPMLYQEDFPLTHFKNLGMLLCPPSNLLWSQKMGSKIH